MKYASGSLYIPLHLPTLKARDGNKAVNLCVCLFLGLHLTANTVFCSARIFKKPQTFEDFPLI